jgi:hypothetical protein
VPAALIVHQSLKSRWPERRGTREEREDWAIRYEALCGETQEHYRAAKDIPAEQARVFREDWFRIGCPSAADLEFATAALPSNGIPSALKGTQAATD